MAPHPDESSGQSRQRVPRSRKHHHHHHHHHDNASLDSGYGGSAASSAAAWPMDGSMFYHDDDEDKKTPQHEAHEHQARVDDADESAADDDDDYDPRSKYYIAVDDDEYRDMAFHGQDLAHGHGDDDDDDRVHSPGRSDDTLHHHHHHHHRHRPRFDRTSSEESIDASISAHAYEKPRRHRRRRTSSSSPPPPSHAPRPAEKAPRKRHGAPPRRLSPTRSDADASDGWETTASRKRGEQLGADAGRRKHRQQLDAWLGAVKRRLAGGVDMAQVRKVGLEAAAVTAVKVAVGTRAPWGQRIPKTIAAGAAAALTDFLVARTAVLQPRGVVGTMFARQFVEIALAGLVVDPAASRISGAARKAAAVGGGGGGGGGRRRRG